MSKIYLPNATQLDTLNEKLGALNDTLGDSGTIQDVQAIDPNGSVCDNFVIPHTGVPEWGMDMAKFISTLNIRDGKFYIDPVSAAQKQYPNYTKTVVYYNDIQTAVNDINNGVTTNGSTTASTTGIKVMKCEGSATAISFPKSLFVLQLLSDVTLEKTLNFQNSCFVDFAGHKIKGTFSSTLTTMISCESSSYPYKQDISLAFYGAKDGSGTEFSLPSTVGQKWIMGFYLLNCHVCFIGGSYLVTGESSSSIYMVHNIHTDAEYAGTDTNNVSHYAEDNCYYALQDAEVKTELTTAPQYGALAVSFVGERFVTVIIDGCSIIDKQGTFTKLAKPALDIGGKKVYAEITNTNIEAESGSSSDQQGAYAAQANALALSIRNCHFKAKNCGLCGNWKFCFVSNCVFEGAEHGGIYCSTPKVTEAYDEINTSYLYISKDGYDERYLGTYIQNTTLRKLDGTGDNHNNLYSCYFGYGSITYCNNVTFDSYNGAYNRPVLKTGENTSAYASKTRAYFSNCNMTSIRVDEGCEAIFGAGIDDSLRTASVGGTITNKPTEIYSSVVSHEMGGLNQWMMDRIRGLEEDGSVDTDKIADGAVTTAKLADATKTALVNDVLAALPTWTGGSY